MAKTRLRKLPGGHRARIQREEDGNWDASIVTPEGIARARRELFGPEDDEPTEREAAELALDNCFGFSIACALTKRDAEDTLRDWIANNQGDES